MSNTNNISGKQKEYVPTDETFMCKLLLGAQLTQEEFNALAKYSKEDLAELAISVTSNKLRTLNNPDIILNAAAVIFGNITTDLTPDLNDNKGQIFQLNLKVIEATRQKQSAEKGLNR